ncbi:Cleavage stimulation factor subunit 50 [Diplonema papillatum]|nr:Cleavage stimulation factor subunit 50 [Diplonema papillatum]
MKPGGSDRQGLYRLMVRQLLYDGFNEAARVLSESTLSAAAGVDDEGGALADIVAAAQEETTEEAEKQARLDSWNTMYNYFGQGEQLMTRYIGAQTKETRCLCWSPDGQYLAAGDSGGALTMHLTEKMMESPGEATTPSTSALARTYSDSAFSVEAATFHPSNPVVITGSRDGSIRLYHYTRPREKKPLIVMKDEFAVRAMAVHPVGKHLLVGNEHPVIRLWDLNTYQAFRAPDNICDIPKPGEPPSAGIINVLDWSPDGNTFASGTGDGNLKLWDPSQPRWGVVSISHCHSGAEVTSVEYSKNGREILTAGNDNCVRLFDLRTYKCLSCWGKPKQTSQRVLAGFTANEECIVVVEKDGIRFMDRNMSDSVSVQQRHTEYAFQRIKAFAPSPRAPFMATGDDGHKIRLWTPNNAVQGFQVELKKPAEAAVARHPSADLSAMPSDGELQDDVMQDVEGT